MNAQEMALFNAGIKGELLSAGRVPATTPDSKMEDYATLYFIEFTKDPEIENYVNDASVVDSLMAFKRWLANGAPTLTIEVVTPVNITVTVTTPTADGKGSVSFALSAIPTNDLPASLVDTFDLLVAGVDSFRKLRSTGQGTPPTYGNNTGGTTAAPTSEVLDIHTVKVEQKNGKIYYRCAGGRWQKFGVAAWQEVWDAAGINPLIYSIGDNPVKFKAEIALDASGKPEKVKRIITG